MNHYTYRAEWFPDRGEYSARCLEFPFIVEWAPSALEALAAEIAAVDERLALLAEIEEPAPPPLTERDYSGRLLIRTSAALHARLAVEAVEQGVSMNQWAVQKLMGRTDSLSLEW